MLGSLGTTELLVILAIVFLIFGVGKLPRLGRDFGGFIREMRKAEEMARPREELDVTERLLEERNKVMRAIPPCPVHGHQCVPHAIKWVLKQRRREEIELEEN